MWNEKDCGFKHIKKIYALKIDWRNKEIGKEFKISKIIKITQYSI